ncbi:probable serine/threonine-protein kinase roco4 [Mytilus californianus]|uniref:probable serine/threonine-protein kinase roco4 n=1 Tax=Mytilus californianus TaxID=6549 RepID=UPI00224679B7|nr:probable serine/threonine-protein kinase roco4 [Mytilus californianus]
MFGVNKPVKEIKVSVTKERFLEESLKAGKKKLHQKKIAPVIIWDFGGQDVFYSTHQTFLTYRAIYLLVLDGSRKLDDPCPFEQYLPGKSGRKTAGDYLKFWINTIVTYCKGSGPGFPKIIIALTHKDKLKAKEVEPRRQQMFNDIEEMFSGSPLLSHLVIQDKMFVNAKDKLDQEMFKIKMIITEQAMKQPTWAKNFLNASFPLN